jgi:hypothetical protein
MSSIFASYFFRRSASKNIRSDGYIQCPDTEEPVSCSLLAATVEAAALEAAGPGWSTGEMARGMEDISLSVASWRIDGKENMLVFGGVLTD